ncbi:hypothetical protein ACFOSD_04805 [Salinispirillum marinum]|uniref:Uncharacterized protein n=2 Tax=Saccharospirillaceae TaxID=255527 RepID=A0ABV8BBE7_9GAMM
MNADLVVGGVFQYLGVAVVVGVAYDVVGGVVFSVFAQAFGVEDKMSCDALTAHRRTGANC